MKRSEKYLFADDGVAVRSNHHVLFGIHLEPVPPERIRVGEASNDGPNLIGRNLCPLLVSFSAFFHVFPIPADGN
jgi:hypothetical protein